MSELNKMFSLSKKKSRVLLIMACLVAAGFGAFIWRAHENHRSIPGRIVRHFKGEAGAEQDINDLAEDVREMPALAPLQSWSAETLEKFKQGKVQTAGDGAKYWWDEPPAIKPAPQERPAFIKHQWGETNEFGEDEPELLIVYGTNRLPVAVAIAWYEHGILIGSVDYQMPYESWYGGLYVKAKPGIFVYHNYK